MASAAYVLDSDAGTYTDDFANNSGVPTRSYVNVNTITGVLQLTNVSNQSAFTTPYAASGNVITGIIKPVLIAEWGVLNVTADIPAGTTLRAQIMDDANNPFTDEIISGNFTQGVDLSETTEIDLSSIPVLHCAIVVNSSSETGCSKTTSVKIKFLMTTSDTAITPSVTGISMNWTRTQGDLESTAISVDDPWPTDYGDQQKTSSSGYYNPQTYPAFKWASERHSGSYSYADLYILKDRILGYANGYEGRLFSLDRNTGEERWKISSIGMINPPGLVGENGTLYGHNMFEDYATAVNSNSGEVKWVYNWMSGHGNGVILGDNGKIYYLRDEANSPSVTLVEQNPDGSIVSQTALNVVLEGLSSESKNVSSMTLAANNVAYFVSDVYNNSTYAPTGKGRLFAINLETKEILWSYLGNFGNKVIVDSEGTAYVFSQLTWGEEATTKKVFAINLDGSLKWERNSGSDTGGGYYSDYGPILRKDGMIVVNRLMNIQLNKEVIEIIDSGNGELIETFDADGYSHILLSDRSNGCYHSSSYVAIDAENNSYRAEMNYVDSEGGLKWKIVYPYSSIENGNSYGYEFSKLAPDERGWFYGGFVKSVHAPGYVAVRSENFVKTYALAPWTFSDHSNITGERKPGDVLNFNVSSSMLTTNPVLGGDNKVQVYMSNGDKVLLSSNSTDSNGNTIWTGSYTIPANFPEGSVSYTIEASQSYLQTDIETHFDNAPTESNNTGIIIAKGFINDASVPTNETKNISVKFGNQKQELKKNSNNYITEKNFKLSGTNEEAKNGQVKIYKKNSKGSKDEIGTASIDENGNWSYKFKKEKDGKTTYYIQTNDLAGNESSMNSFKIIRDTEDPYFKEFPKTGIYKRGTKIHFEAEDDDTGLDYFKVKLYPKKGSWQKLKGNDYIIPQSILPGVYTLAVKVYDKAGNVLTKMIPIAVR